MILTAFHASTTGDGPFARLEHEARRMERDDPRVLCVSLFHVGSYIDVPEMGCSTLVITDGDPRLARAEATRLADTYWGSREEFLVETISVAEAVARGRGIDGGPVLLLNTADTTGGGAAGDSIAVARGLIEAGVDEPAIAMVVDPVAAARACAAGVGSAIELEIGHGRGSRWGTPWRTTVTVTRVVDGMFRYTGGIFGGTDVSMGPSAVLAIGQLRLLVMSHSTYDWADEQYRAAGLDPVAAKFIAAKNPMNYRFAYRDIASAMLVIDTPGPTPAHVLHLPYERIDRPAFPFEDSPQPPRIDVLRSTVR